MKLQDTNKVKASVLEEARGWIETFGAGIKDFLITELKIPEEIADALIEEFEEHNPKKVELVENEVIDFDNSVQAVLVTIEDFKPIKKYLYIDPNLENIKSFLNAKELEIKDDIGIPAGSSKYIAICDKEVQKVTGCHWFSIENNFIVGNVLVFEKDFKDVEDINDIKISYEGLSENLDEIFGF